MSPFLSPDLALIERELDKVLTRAPGDRVLGIRASDRRCWPDSVERQGVRFRLVWCGSELEIREQMDAVSADEGVVVLTPLESGELGCDVVSRLPRGRLVQTDRWAALRSAFKAGQIDPRLRSQGWLADLLLADAPRTGYMPAAADMLDLQTAWQALIGGVLRVSGDCGDVADLLVWTLDSAGPENFLAMPEEARSAIVDYMAVAGGGSAALVMGGVGAGRAADMLAFGLACSVVFAEDAPVAKLRDAAIRLEHVIGGMPLEATAGLGLAKAAGRVLTRLIVSDPALARTVQAQAALLLSDIRAVEWVDYSSLLDFGLDARMVKAAQSLTNAVALGGGDHVRTALALVQRAHAHERSGERRTRLDRLQMALRLARWLVEGERASARTMPDAARRYALDGGYVDLARHALRGGDELSEVRMAYAALRDRALPRREAENREFAGVLRDWLAAGAPGTDPLPVEKILDAVVAPLACAAPVLLLVLDGLSFAVWRSIADGIVRLGWTELQSGDGQVSSVGVAVVPSVTEASRASLLSGGLGRGDQAHERAHFRANPAMVRADKRKPPLLFHKAGLGFGPDLEPALRDALADPKQRVVGVVHNAVDAQLSGSDQLDVAWSADGLRHVTPMLRIARDVGRLLIVTGDHGHIVDEGAIRTPAATGAGAGARWRDTGPAGEGELAVAGARVLSPDGSHSLVGAWSERLRNGAPRSGYHGGISPQEILVPLAVLTSGPRPPGWKEAAPTFPPWWSGDSRVDDVTAPTQQAVARPRRPLQPGLFNRLEPPSQAAIATNLGVPAWIDLLFASASYKAQQRLASRGAPPDEQTRSLLIVLAARGGKLSQVGLATALELPLVRVPGLVNAARRVLNLDQVQILTMEGGYVLLDAALLITHFELAP